jgi:alpha-galactosidase/6-phospho-beta-glucosidase family protein
MSAPKITFIGAGSTVFVKNILGDVFQRPALKSAHIALMDIDATRLEESHIVVRKLMDSVGATVKSAAIAIRNCAAGCGFCGGRFPDWRL